jgi:hypothetical protein
VSAGIESSRGSQSKTARFLTGCFVLLFR